MSKNAYITNFGINANILGIECSLKVSKGVVEDRSYHIDISGKDFIACGAVGCTFLATQISPAKSEKVLVKFEKGFNVSNSKLKLSKMFDLVQYVNETEQGILPDVYGISLLYPQKHTQLYVNLVSLLTQLRNVNTKYKQKSSTFLQFISPGSNLIDETNTPVINNPLYFIVMEYIKDRSGNACPTWRDVFNSINQKVGNTYSANSPAQPSRGFLVNKTIKLINDPKNHIYKKLIIDLYKKIYKLHSLNVIHGDLHGENILCLPDNTIRLIDFGRFDNGNKGWVDEYKTNYPGLINDIKFWYDLGEYIVKVESKPKPISTIKPQSGKNNLIKFHIRSDVFSYPAIWAEATRTLHKNWKQQSLMRYNKDGQLDIHNLYRTDCTIMSLALLDWPYRLIKEEQSKIINSKQRKLGKSMDEIIDIISKVHPNVNRANIRIERYNYTSTENLIKLYKSIFSKIDNSSGVLVNVYPIGKIYGHAVVFAKDPYGTPIILDAQQGVKFNYEVVKVTKAKDMEIEGHEIIDEMEIDGDDYDEITVKKPVGLYGRYGLGVLEKKEQGGREQIRYLAERFSNYGDLILFVSSKPELDKVFCWDYSKKPPIVVPYNPATYQEIRPQGYPTLRDQLKFLGEVDVYKLKNDSQLPRADDDPVFFGKLKKKKKKYTRRKKPSKLRKLSSKIKTALSSLKENKKKKKKKKASRTKRR